MKHIYECINRAKKKGLSLPYVAMWLRGYVAIFPLLILLAGCPVMQQEDTPVPARHVKGGVRDYWIYVPSNYSADRTWPMVVTLHGSHLWDSASAQIRSWKELAEEKGLIVVAPRLESTQGTLPKIRSAWYKDLKEDEAAILAVMDEVRSKYRVDKQHVIMTGFSAGGYPLYYVGLTHPDRFEMIIGCCANSDIGILEQIKFTPEARKVPIVVFWGRDDSLTQKEGFQAVEYLSNHGCDVEFKRVPGGHGRRPDMVYRYWKPRLPKSMLP